MADDRLTHQQILDLASCVFARDMKLIALGYLDLDEVTVKNLQYENEGDPQAFNHEILRNWANKNSGPDQVKVTVWYEISRSEVFCSLICDFNNSKT